MDKNFFANDITMKTKTDILARRLAMTLLAICVASIAWAQQLNGLGTEKDPYLISSSDDWKIFTDKINNGESSGDFYKLTKDITLGVEGNPINTVVGKSKDIMFNGTFDGAYHTITLYMERKSDYAAPFGVTNGATIKNLKVEGTIISDHKFAGGFVGYANNKNNSTTSLTNCISSVHIICDDIVLGTDVTRPFDCTHGGLVGQNESGTIRFVNCVFDGWIKDRKENKTANKCTGFIGWVNNNVYYTNCVMAGTIDVKPNDGNLKNSMATFHRLAGNAKPHFIGTSYYINDYTYSGMTVYGTEAPKSLPENTIARKYTVGKEDYFIPTVTINEFNLTFNGWKLVEDIDYTLDITSANNAQEVIFTGTNNYGGNYTYYINASVFNTKGRWNDASNWGDEGVPAPGSNIVLKANVNIPSSYTANAGHIFIKNNAVITVEDGGQLVCQNSVPAVINRRIEAATAVNEDPIYGWYVISSPIADAHIIGNTNIVTATNPDYDFDLLRYSESRHMWETYHFASHNHFNNIFETGRGYLYRNANNMTASFTGKVYVDDVECYLSYTPGNGKMAGWNLIGNPYSHEITTDYMEMKNVNATGFYFLNYDGTWTSSLASEAHIAPAQGFLVKATDKNSAVFMSNQPKAKTRATHDFIAFTVANNDYEDVTYALFDEGNGLEKLNHRNDAAPMLYIEQNGNDYAIATMSDETKAFYLSFQAHTTGIYNLSISTKGEFNYLHIIDRLTGEDVDMLLEDNYSFIGSPSDINARFIVKLSYIACDNIDNEIFAYQSGSDIIVSGEGELQIFDITGRFVSATQINGIETLSTSSLKGVYILRLTGDETKTQKIVVK